MKGIVLLVVFSSLFSSAANSRNDIRVSKYICASVGDDIDRINSQMRAGYNAREGERLRDRLRLLKKTKNKCKKSHYPISNRK